MNNFNIDITDFKNIESLLNINKNIERLYTKLGQLEIENKTYTKEYTQLLEYISFIIEAEDKIYKESNLDTTKKLSWLKFLRNIYDKNNSVLIRINNYIFANLIGSCKRLIELPDKELSNILIMSGIKATINKDKKEEICKLIIVKEAIQKDLWKVFLSSIQRNINNPKQRMFKETLIKAKYDAIFFNKDLEISLINKKFNITNNPLIISNFRREILEMDVTTYQNIKDVLCTQMITNEISDLLNINDYDYNNVEKASLSIIKESMIKSCLLFISDEKINEINEHFYKLIGERKDNEMPSNNISKEIINNCFKSVKEEKTNIKILSKISL